MDSRLIVSLRRPSRSCAGRITLLSPAKINLYLNIIGKYANGFHRIESVVERLSLCDELTIETQRSPSITITSNLSWIATKDNLCVRAGQLMQRVLRIRQGFRISLFKKIPVGSGLGGGSSNAASTIIGICRLLGMDLSLARLYQLGSRLGSDVNFFLSQSPFALLSGRGQRVLPLDIGTMFKHRLIWPGFSLSTAKVYRTGSTRLKLTKFFSNVNIIKYALQRADTSLLEDTVFNILEKKAYCACPKLKKAAAFLKTRGVQAHMTGSGSAFYTIDTPTSSESCPEGQGKSSQPVSTLSASEVLAQRSRRVDNSVAGAATSLATSSLRSLAPKAWLIFDAQTF